MTSPLSDLVHELRAEAEHMHAAGLGIPARERQACADRLEAELRKQGRELKDKADALFAEDVRYLALCTGYRMVADMLVAGLEGDDGEQ